MIKLEFNKLEVEILIKAIDSTIRTVGLASAISLVPLYEKIETELKKQETELIKE